ncbi:hypothetical protein [Bradyrhizobium zhanjiangense]|uniref:Uncharacterized protein n=1 Tax=Bradyrhizobium zhanjiangense TaxID=1325107 RepID=A0ABY0DKS4_9BRAD|nr:hypothetical protein [Bradyrhizobium zhanjiangense]RXG93031.1 hypothetical protein EAS62_20250 [Bradyrhizobium zhanjiangense]
MPIKHSKTSDVADAGIPANWVKPSDWNDEHELTGLLAALDTIGVQPNTVPFIDGASGGATFLISAFVRSLMNSATATAFLALLGAAALNSPAFTGTPTAPTPAGSDNSQTLATTAFVQARIAALVAGSPGLLDTLNELAAALGNDPNFATTMTNALALKAPLNSPALTGTPTAPTVAGSTDSTTKIATTAFVQACILALAAVARTGAYSDLSGKPTLGTAAALDVGATANKVVQLDGSAKLPAVDGSQLTNVPATITSMTSSLGADVAMSVTNTYYDGPSIAQGSVGKWEVCAVVTVTNTAAATEINWKLWDGTTVIASGSAPITASGARQTISTGVHPINTPAGNLRISLRDIATSTSKMEFNRSGSGKDCTISATRIG